jgi:predicted amidohydrolase
LAEAAYRSAQVVLFPEYTFTTVFPRYFFTDEDELYSFFGYGNITTAEHARLIFDRAKDLGVDICIGFAGTA